MSASLKYWMVVPLTKKGKTVGYAMRGEVEGHPWQPDGKRITTSKLVRIEGDNERAVCESRTYKLGPPDNGWWTEFTRQGHTLAEFGAGPPAPVKAHSSLGANLKALVGLRVAVSRTKGDLTEGFEGPLVRVEETGLVVDVAATEMTFPFQAGWKIRRAV